MFENGEILSFVLVGYEIYGIFFVLCDNCILLEYVFIGMVYVVKYFESDVFGWWDDYIGLGKMIDIDKYFLVCINVFGGCSGMIGFFLINLKIGEFFCL